MDWDDQIDGSFARKALEWFNELPHSADLRLPRCLRLDESQDMCSIELHTFILHASQDVLRAAVYALTSYSNGHVIVCLVASKSRVAPLLAVSILRLEWLQFWVCQ